VEQRNRTRPHRPRGMAETATANAPATAWSCCARLAPGSARWL